MLIFPRVTTTNFLGVAISCLKSQLANRNPAVKGMAYMKGGSNRSTSTTALSDQWRYSCCHWQGSTESHLTSYWTLTLVKLLDILSLIGLNSQDYSWKLAVSSPKNR